MQQPGNRPGAFRLRVAISAMTLAIWAVATIPAAADDAVETRQLVEISARAMPADRLTFRPQPWPRPR